MVDVIQEYWPESFNNWFSWRWFEKLRYRDSPAIPILGENWHYPASDHSWHMDIKTVLPHTKRHRALVAICRDDYNELKKVLDEGFDINAPVDLEKGKRALAVAAFLNRPKLLRYLILRGANLDLTDEAGNTALMDSVERVNFECMMQLVDQGANINKKNHLNKTVVEKAEERSQQLLLGYLRESSKKSDLKKPKLPDYDITFDFERTFLDPLGHPKGIGRGNRKSRLFFKPGVNYPFNSLSGSYVFGVHSELQIKPELHEA